MSTFIDNLNGFFQALRRLGLSARDFWAFELSIESSLEESVIDYFSESDSVEVVELLRVSYSDVVALYERYIFSSLEGLTDATRDLLEWDIVEYYGLHSTALNPEGDFNPLVSKGALQVLAKSPSYSELVYYVVQYEISAIVTGLGIRA